MDNFQKMAVLIDADNTQLSRLEEILHEISTYGRIVVKKAYGNWKKDLLKNWESELKRLAIKAEQQFDYVTGKNTTDIAMIIGAMDLLYTEKYDAFILVSSDSDFTPLAIRLRESGLYVIGAGVSKTPESFKNACDDFILIELLQNSEEKKAIETIPLINGNNSTVHENNHVKNKTEHQNAKGNITDTNDMNPLLKEDDIESIVNIKEIHKLLKIAYEKYQDEKGYTNVSAAGAYIKRVKPDFNSKIYGYSKLSELMGDFPEEYVLLKEKGKGGVLIISYRCMD